MTMKKLYFCCLISLLFALPAQAQQANVVTSCGSITLGTTQYPLTVDTKGRLCSDVNALPSGATPVTISGNGTTTALASILPGVASKTTYICGFSSTATATAAVAGASTLAGTISGTLNFVQGVGTSPAVVTLTQTFWPCVPASAVNTAITFTSVAPGTGGVISNSLWGYQQ
jgi:hypothetical protein